jgi:hypothetical protein
MLGLKLRAAVDGIRIKHLQESSGRFLLRQLWAVVSPKPLFIESKANITKGGAWNCVHVARVGGGEALLRSCATGTGFVGDVVHSRPVAANVRMRFWDRQAAKREGRRQGLCSRFRAFVEFQRSALSRATGPKQISSSAGAALNPVGCFNFRFFPLLYPSLFRFLVCAMCSGFNFLYDFYRFHLQT